MKMDKLSIPMHQRRIGIMAEMLGDANQAAMVNAAIRTCESHGFSTLVVSSGVSELEERYAWETLSRSDCEGLLLTSEYLDNDSLARLMSTRKNVVLANLHNVHVGTLAAEHLISQGHRQIAVVTGPQHRFSTQHRIEGFLKQSEKPLWRNVTLETLEAPFSKQGGANAMKILLSRKIQPTAVFFHHDIMALGAMSACKDNNVRIPNDVSILGCGDIDSASLSTPTLSSVYLPLEALGKFAATRLINQINGVQVAPSKVTDSKLLLPSIESRSSVRDITKTMVPGAGADSLVSTRERDCLQWAAKGKTSWEMSQILGISESTIIYHLRNATKKLDAANRMHAVAKALKAELIEI